MRRPAPFPRALALLAAASVGCAHAGKMTFEEAGLAPAYEPEGPAEPPVRNPSPHRVASELPAGPAIEGLLARFAGGERERRQRFPAGRSFPADAAAAWAGFLPEIDRYLSRPLPQTPLLELIRARVTLETELQFDSRRFGAPPRELHESVTSEVRRFEARIATLRGLARKSFGRTPAPALSWPLDDPKVSSRFGIRLHPLDGRRKMHYGVDLTSDRGLLVSAAAQGFVVRAGWTSGYGLLVEVRHSWDLTTRYSHLSKLLCAPGDAVESGQPLGIVGASGTATGPHLHFEVWQGLRAVDPLRYLRRPSSDDEDEEEGYSGEGDAGD